MRTFTPRKIRFVFSLCALAITAACASSNIRVESYPDQAEVYLTYENQNREKVGKTPLVLNDSTHPALFRYPVHLSVEKEGYQSSSVLIPASTVSMNARVSAQLQSKDSQTQTKDASEAVARILQLIYRKDYLQAERLLESYLSRYSSVPVFWDLQGNVFYLEKKLDQALVSYETSLRLNPQNGEAAKMIEKIKSIRGLGGNP